MVKKPPPYKATKRTSSSPVSTRLTKCARTEQNDDTIRVTINQTTDGAPTDENLVSQPYPARAVQTPVSWSPIQRPDNTNSAITSPQVPQIWPSTWNQGTQSYATTPQPPQVPWMTTGMTTQSPAYPWRTRQPQWMANQCAYQPNQATPAWHTPLVQWQNAVPNPTAQWQHPALPNPPVTVALTTQQQQGPMPPVPATMTTTMTQQPALTTAQLPNYIPPIMPGAVTAFNQSDLPGKPLDIIISTHVPQSIKNKVWSYNYIDLGVLIDTHNPDEQEQFDLMPDRQTNNIMLKATNKHVNITSFALWNKAFQILIKLTACKWPQLCLPMVQYSHFINKQSGKFPFQQVYTYNKKFCHQMSTNPSFPWNQIDNQLWSRELHGQAIKDKLADSNFCGVCFDYNKGRCNRVSCKFHRCNKCNRSGHPAIQCRSRPTTTGPSTSGTIPNSDTSQPNTPRTAAPRAPQSAAGTTHN